MVILIASRKNTIGRNGNCAFTCNIVPTQIDKNAR